MKEPDKMIDKPCRRRGQEIVRAQERDQAKARRRAIDTGICMYCGRKCIDNGIGPHMKFCKEKPK